MSTCMQIIVSDIPSSGDPLSFHIYFSRIFTPPIKAIQKNNIDVVLE